MMKIREKMSKPACCDFRQSWDFSIIKTKCSKSMEFIMEVALNIRIYQTTLDNLRDALYPYDQEWVVNMFKKINVTKSVSMF